MPRSRPVAVLRPDESGPRCCALLLQNLFSYRPVHRRCAKNGVEAELDGQAVRLCVQHLRQAEAVGFEWMEE